MPKSAENFITFFYFKILNFQKSLKTNNRSNIFHENFELAILSFRPIIYFQDPNPLLDFYGG